MKWGNHDINVVERPNIPMFSKLDDTMTPFRLLELVFDDVLGLLSTPSCIAIQRKQMLVLNSLMKKLAYS